MKIEMIVALLLEFERQTHIEDQNIRSIESADEGAGVALDVKAVRL